jgi:hypothetical protein
MPQLYTSTINNSDMRATVLKTTLPNNDEALRSCFSGASAPSSPLPGQLWFDTSTKALWQRDSTGTLWIAVKRREIRFGDVALAARTWRGIPRTPVPLIVESLVIVPSTTTVASVATTKEWTWTLKNQSTTLNLFSAIPSTATTVGGVGGGELTADVPYVLLANQNQALAAGAELRFVVGVNGAPTAVADFAAIVTAYEALP